MEILVIGGAGFQGSHLTESLLADGHWVTVLNTPSKNTTRNMQGFQSHERVSFISGSVTDGETVYRAVRDHHVVFHLAARTNVDESLSDPKSFLETNVMGTYRALEAVRRYRNRLIYVSTCEVYGDGHNLEEGQRLDEHAELKPNSPYAASKAAADRLCYSYFRSFGIDVTIVRPFNIFGIRQKTGRFGALIPRLVRQAINGKNLTIFGAGTSSRDYLYISDIVNAYNLILQTPSLRGQTINFASGKDTCVKDIVEYVAGKFDATIEHRDARPGEVQRFPADISLARSIGFEPQVDIWEGIDRYIAWAKDQPQHAYELDGLGDRSTANG
ncbi:NAD-dependent epimerase/dehydratase family protein [Mycobacterium marinum]|uniref:dTDP-glucose-4,6-dehydratase, RmlB_1 n=2 Tax=Mycobacterium marinum TaxID=1781 RepID=B2HLL8_MYCMM|nr:NAD-dependent epimerase/dehydratase family protein [Mycobacterium marinum]ACC43750.1 dTDP-glucose-4,6-dehydratase, RmlB_1 [Mycobacterium marinum M]AXN47278.1 dTDP-glucose 4,6-dehydratase [Mycobacterium marinum]AXN52709.1 dTDP-glucose 4,6-dehydratase [Mycobacterium marinum]EPQ72117.1 dTDP-glucose 4,6-dehydratase [Mycobacterium marinum str. Europe]EPQ79027.1 dTDP-glucose 4,6-dehydratase [Mycobacterium marinum MB2]